MNTYVFKSITLSMIFLSILIIQSSFGQVEENRIEIVDNLNSVGLKHNLLLANHLTLEGGLLISQQGGFNVIELPVVMNIALSDKWELFFGSKLSAIRDSNKVLSNPSSNADVNIHLVIGTQYNFTDSFSGHLSIQQNLLDNKANSYYLNTEQNQLQLNFGLKFNSN